MIGWGRLILSAISAMVLKALMSALSLLETSRRLLYIALPLESKLALPVPGPEKYRVVRIQNIVKS